MKILFTGSSSFTGYWFIKELVKAGHNVLSIFTKNGIDDYDDFRKQRVIEIVKNTVPYWNLKFGDENFIKLIESEKIDILCHHASWVINYKSVNFDLSNAIANNTHNIQEVLKSLISIGRNKFVYTGTIFEGREGAGNSELKPFSPYGLSKQLSSEIIRFYTSLMNIDYGKFVISNPFGPMEEFRFTQFLMKKWKEETIPKINTPDYVRDNIHISLLAKCYVKFLENFFQDDSGYYKINPSGYVETQAEFTQRFSKEIGKRLNLNCEFEITRQIDFSEPLKRFNKEPAKDFISNWNEEIAWDEYANYYKEKFNL